jgi:hypothetical protein
VGNNRFRETGHPADSYFRRTEDDNLTRLVDLWHGAAKRFRGRFLHGTSAWNAPVLLSVLVVYAALSALLLLTNWQPAAKAAVLTAFVALLVVAAILYYGSRQSGMTVALEHETERADLEKELADKLQEAFLQQQLPAVSNLGFSATYLPAAATVQVGGDWYDAFELPHGRILFSIGDVAGHGIDAAVTMSRARQAIIAAALYEADPGAILERANKTLMLQDTRFATAICGFVDPATLQVTYATAGHPPAILTTPLGGARLLEYDGLPLGIHLDATYPSFTFAAEPHSMLVLYTDGLLEYDRNLIQGERRMLETARAIAGRRVDNPAAEIQDAIFAQYEPLDDVAILTISFRDGAGRTQHDGENSSVALRGVRTPYMHMQT